MDADTDDGGASVDASVCTPACDDEPNADVACTVFATCESSCRSGFARCGDDCVAESPTRCGAGCATCPVPSDGEATCEDGVCGVVCAPGFVPCPDDFRSSGCCPFASEVVAPQEFGGEAPLVAVDGTGAVHLVYEGGASGGPEAGLIYATDRDGSWRRERVIPSWTSAGERRLHIGLGPSGPLVLYTDPFANTALLFAERRASGWSQSVVVPELPAHFAMVTDRAGRAHVCFSQTASYPGVNYAIRRGDRWTFSQAADEAEALGPCAIAVDRDGLAHIAYYRVGSGDVIYARGDASGSFELATADAEGDVGGRELAIAVGADGTPHVAAMRVDVPALRHAQPRDGRWTAETVVPGLDGQRLGIAVNGAGIPVMIYLDRSEYDLVATEWDGVEATTHVVVTNSFGSIATAPDGSIFVASGHPRVVVHHRIGADWRATPVDTDDRTEGDVSLLHRGAQPVLVYTRTRQLESRIEIATRTGSAWSYAQLPGPGSNASAALDGDGPLHIAYSTGPDLEYAVETAQGRFTVEPVASGARDVSIALDEDGAPHVAYVGAGSLVHGVRGKAGWSATPIDSGGAYRRPVLQIGPGGVLHVLWHDPTAGQTIYASSADGFANVVVEANAAAGHDLLVTPAGVPHACFLRRAASPGQFPDLRYGSRPAATWSNVLVAPPGTEVNDDICAIGADPAGAIAIARSLRFGIGFGRLVITVLGSPNRHTQVHEDFYTYGFSLTAGPAGLEIGSAGQPYSGVVNDQLRVRWSHR